MVSDVKSSVSLCGRYHINQGGERLYPHSFDKVLPFHAVESASQLAPVTLNNLSWHILTTGESAYTERYDETFGFYCGLSAVKKDDEWFHINGSGKPVYQSKYSFVGNFQQDISVVCNAENRYFHIDKLGESLYKSTWCYCGDFREGSSVVQADSGLSTHILKDGSFLHGKWFQDLDVYHKGYARAQSQDGWHHIDQCGESLYSAKYAKVEPFYNGCARVEGYCGSIFIINEQGKVLRTTRSATKDRFSELSADMVGYWKTFTIATAVELEVFEHLPSRINELASLTQTDEAKLARLLSALGELEILSLKSDVWNLLPKGEFLLKSHEISLASASLEYRGDLLKRWYQLPEVIKGFQVKQDIFDDVDSSTFRRGGHHKMLRSYAIHDYAHLVEYLPIENNDIVFDAAGGNGALCEILKKHYPKAHLVLGDLPNVISDQSSKYFSSLPFDLFKEWPIKPNKIILSRVLHDWDNRQVVTILGNAKKALKGGGEILILEMLIDKSGFSGSLCDLHLLACTGGQERTLSEFKKLCSEAGLTLHSTTQTSSLITILRVSK